MKKEKMSMQFLIPRALQKELRIALIKDGRNLTEFFTTSAIEYLKEKGIENEHFSVNKAE